MEEIKVKLFQGIRRGGVYNSKVHRREITPLLLLSTHTFCYSQYFISFRLNSSHDLKRAYLI